MPNLPAHIDLAQQAAERLACPVLDSDMGHYLLGATSPDIRVITRGSRQQYHFAPLDFTEVGAGTKGLLRAHPHLRPAYNGSARSRAFVAGYITHLVLDETWIVDMYRPYFGNPKVFSDTATGKVMDRALQLELDRQSHDCLKKALLLIGRATGAVNTGFLSPQTVSDYKVWVLKFLEGDFTWDRLRFMARRIAAGDDEHPAHRVAAEFLEGMPQSLDRLRQRLAPKEIERFKEKAIALLASSVEEYLS